MTMRVMPVMVALVMATGGACSLEADAGSTAGEVRADLDALREQVAALEAAVQCPRLLAPFDEPAAPRVYERVGSGAVVLCRHRASGGEMVKVGDVWVDRYELSVCAGGGVVGDETGHDTTARACSVAGVMPKTGITWFQAAALCANAGKRLCSNAEWQAAVSGTKDPASSDGMSGACVTAGGLRATGMGVECRSRFGAEDMIGNVREWVADWQQAGHTWQGVDGQVADPGPWPANYHDDRTWNHDGTTGAGVKGRPVAAVRGGYYAGQAQAGAFAFDLSISPSDTLPSLGARCCAWSR